MRLVATKQAKAGEKLGKPIYDLEGRPLLRRGAVLTERLLTRLYNLGRDEKRSDSNDKNRVHGNC